MKTKYNPQDEGYTKLRTNGSLWYRREGNEYDLCILRNGEYFKFTVTFDFSKEDPGHRNRAFILFNSLHEVDLLLQNSKDFELLESFRDANAGVTLSDLIGTYNVLKSLKFK